MTSEIEARQNAVPTDFSVLDASLMQMQNNATRYAADNRLHVRFFSKPIINMQTSTEAGRPIYQDREMVEIMAPGNKYSVIIRVARDLDKRRFSRQYEQYKSGVEQVIGTPLALMPFLSPAQVEELAFFKVRTAEQLAEMADSSAGAIMGGHGLKRSAKEWLQKQSSNEVLMARITALEAQLGSAKSSGSKANKEA